MRIYNTLTGKKEDFIPLEENTVKMYVCGPTVYGPIHVGNARPAIVFDVFRRYLEYRGYKVIMVQNFTDIDDKIIKKANELNVSFRDVSETFINEYWRDSYAMGIKQANFHPKTSDYIKEIINLIQKLIEKDFAYVVDGDVYFDVRKYKSYGELSKRNLEDMIAGARVEVSDKKRYPLDFALWKSAKPNEPWWDSPWGRGRPGWHIECSAMAMTLLGESFDIHAGGEDLIFPHHENERAQSEAITGKVFAKYWMHNGLVRILGDKMSKSVGNIVNVREAIKRFGRDSIRYFFLSKHYRSPVEFSEKSLKESYISVKRVWESIERFEKRYDEIPIPKRDSWQEFYVEKFIETMDEDFNTPGAVSIIFELIREMNKAMDEGDEKRALKAYHLVRREFGPILGLFDLEREKRIEEKTEEILTILLDVRRILRKEKRFDLSDEIREKLENIGIKVKDTPDGFEYILE
ncbi:MAG TPA: cysteine--tRNA ligase [Thermotoga sp.]|nr:cysteine--tRNA ligase [Thermotoga sp.]